MLLVVRRLADGGVTGTQQLDDAVRNQRRLLEFGGLARCCILLRDMSRGRDRWSLHLRKEPVQLGGDRLLGSRRHCNARISR